jgi:hypothetical protein
VTASLNTTSNALTEVREQPSVMEKHGFLSFMIYPDYITTDLKTKIYEALFSHLAELREDTRRVWH